MLTEQEKERLLAGNLTDPIVRMMLAGFIAAHLLQHGVEIDPLHMVHALDMFALAMKVPGFICESVNERMQRRAH